MRMRLPTSLTPLAPEWEAYCDYALQTLNDTHSRGATVTWVPHLHAFALMVPGLETSYFKVSSATCEDPEGQLERWSVNLGTGVPLLHPYAEKVTRHSGKVSYLLRLLFDGADVQSGMFRVCAKLVRHAEKLTPEEVSLLRTLAARFEE